jgi:hypothetical protein
MAYYRVYLLNEADRIVDGHWIERDSDAEAITGAVALARTRGVEVWCGGPQDGRPKRRRGGATASRHTTDGAKRWPSSDTEAGNGE